MVYDFVANLAIRPYLDKRPQPSMLRQVYQLLSRLNGSPR